MAKPKSWYRFLLPIFTPYRAISMTINQHDFIIVKNTSINLLQEVVNFNLNKDYTVINHSMLLIDGIMFYSVSMIKDKSKDVSRET